jgi:hypothetical protein
MNDDITQNDLITAAGAKHGQPGSAWHKEQRSHPVKTRLVLAALILTSTTVFAQSPYAGMQTRSIKALSEQQVADLKEGRGMGLALAAELNGYPGPIHLLELADKLDLSADQRSKLQELFASMKQEAIPIGARLLEQESELDREFVNHTITPERLKSATAAIAATQGTLRETHHLSTVALLTQSQMHRYSELRGYGDHDLNPMHHGRIDHSDVGVARDRSGRRNLTR